MNFAKLVSKFRGLATTGDVKNVAKDVQKSQISIGKLFGEFNLASRKAEILNDIRKAEFQVFSQWGDDGIIHFLTRYLAVEPQTFVEFGVESYRECNTRFLLVNSNWSGLIIDGSERNIEQIKAEDLMWQYDLTAIAKFVTAENINELISQKFTGDLGILHIDVDGNDYWIWKAIHVVRPVIVIMEYNSLFGYDKPWTIPYDAGFTRTKNHFSNLLYGSSLLSLCDLAEEKGYNFIGCNSNGNNAYFVRKDRTADIKTLKAKEGYALSKFSESRDAHGKLNFLRDKDRIEALRGQSVFNTRTNSMETIS